MGFVFFTGGWRRFYNVPAKLDITSPAHLSNKLVEAAPGSPIEPMVHWVLYHPWIAEWSVYLMSAAEIVVGLGLVLGLLTRVSAVGAALINVVLMLIFGWQGYECLDEWTMAALGFAISIGALLQGAGAYSLDRALGRDFFAWMIGRNTAVATTIISVVFTVGFYSYFFLITYKAQPS